MNREARRRELIKITKENQQILKRLQNKKATYNVSSWQRDEETRTRMLRNICEYPLLEKSLERPPLGVGPDFIIKRKKTAASTGNGFY